MKQIAQGPSGWATAAASLVPILALLAVIGGSIAVAIPKGKAAA
jgi:hypothetical protein